MKKLRKTLCIFAAILLAFTGCVYASLIAMSDGEETKEDYMGTYTNQKAWRAIQEFLPVQLHYTDSYQPTE